MAQQYLHFHDVMPKCSGEGDGETE